ncbi:MAG: hypothetical protein AAB459_01085 [Patescibacteria group bacterium]
MEVPADASPERTTLRHLDLFPMPEDWDALQGGKPRVFRSTRNPNAVWQVVHVYEQHSDAKKRFKSGIIVPTIPPHLSHSGRLELSHKMIEREDWEGNSIRRNFSIPSMMDRTVHGDICKDRSLGVHGAEYDRLADQTAYEAFLKRMEIHGYEEIIFGVNNQGFTLSAYSEIAPSRPLQS